MDDPPAATPASLIWGHGTDAAESGDPARFEAANSAQFNVATGTAHEVTSHT